jgi:hypothetical protein
MTESDPKIEVRIPEDEDMRLRIDTMAKFVAADGEAFEQVCCHDSARISV